MIVQVGAGCCLGLLMKPIQKLLGGRLRIFCTGSAPLAVGTQKFVSTVFNCPVRQAPPDQPPCHLHPSSPPLR